ncbi:cell division protein FtsL [Endothiovibrio diazotrophicus]
MSAGRVPVAILAAASMLTAFGVVYAKHASRKEFIELQGLQAQRNRMNVEWGRLLLEEGAWSSHGRIEKTARERLGMRLPRAEDVVIVRRRLSR